MKANLHRFLKYCTTLLVLLLLVTNCEHEQTLNTVKAENSQIRTNGSVATFVSKENIPKIIDYLNNKANKISKKTKKDINILRTNNGVVQLQNIMQVIDTLNRDNYSFELLIDDTDLYTFYNLVVGPLDQNNQRPSYILKYEMNPSFAEDLYNGHVSMYNFRGKIKKYAFDTFFNGQTEKSSCTEPCEVYDFEDDYEQVGGNDGVDGIYTGGNVGGGNGATTGTGGETGANNGGSSSIGGGSAGGGGGGPTVILLQCGCEPQHDVGQSCACHEKPTIMIVYKTANSNCDCDESSGTVGINFNEFTIPYIEDCLGPLTDEQSEFLMEHPKYITNIGYYKYQNGCTEQTQNFMEQALEAWMAGGDVDFDEAYIYTNTPDDNYNFQGEKQYISNPLTLSDGTSIDITFGTTSDNVNANQPVSVDLIDGLKFALEEANNNLSSSEQITSIYIMCTTNGHGTTGTSNHLKSTAVDISRINNKKMILSGITNQIIELQKSMNNYQYIRENFGPYLKYKYSIETNSWNYNYPIGGHKDHIHFSVRK